MNGKWQVFTMGILIGVIACLTTALAMSHGQITAAAAPAPAPAQNVEGRLIAVTGGTQANIDDMLYVVYMRPTPQEDEGSTSAKLPKERITLALYKPEPGRTKDPQIDLRAIREISWDLQLMQFKTTPKLEDILETIKSSKKP